jgi:hypothetical protein
VRRREPGLDLSASTPLCARTACSRLPGAAPSRTHLLELLRDPDPRCHPEPDHREERGSDPCRLLVEGANGPTSLEADAILANRGVYVVPDILANAGGVTVSYFEWVQGLQHFLWTEEEVNNRLIGLMQQAFREVLAVAAAKSCDLRTAALMRGIGRITEAKRRRGIFP